MRVNVLGQFLRRDRKTNYAWENSLVGTHKSGLIITQTAVIGLINAKVQVFRLYLNMHQHQRKKKRKLKKKKTPKDFDPFLALEVVENEEKLLNKRI